MRTFIMPILFLLGIQFSFNANVYAETTCKQGALERKVKVVNEGTVPCQVEYLKDASDATSAKVIFDAKNDPEFCTKKASEFVAKLEGMGWTCDGMASTTQPKAEGAQEANETQGETSKQGTEN